MFAFVFCYQRVESLFDFAVEHRCALSRNQCPDDKSKKYLMRIRASLCRGGKNAMAESAVSAPKRPKSV